jgi:cell division protein FtsB
MFNRPQPYSELTLRSLQRAGILTRRAKFVRLCAMSKQPAPHSLSPSQVFTAIALGLTLLILIVMAQRMTTTYTLWRQTQALQAEIEAARQETTRLEQRKRYVQSDEYIELIARRELKMAKPGEVTVIGVPVSAMPAAK